VLNKLFFTTKQNLIGVDISATSIKLIELEKFRNTCRVKSFGIQPNEEINHNLGLSLKKLFTTLKIKTKNIALALPYSSIINKDITLLSSIKKNEIENFLKLNTQKHLGYPLDKICFDYQIQNNKKNNDTLQIKAVIAKKEQAQKLAEIAISAKLKAKTLDVNAFALARAGSFLLAKENYKTVLLANINYDSALFCVLHQLFPINIQESFPEKSKAQTLESLSEYVIQYIKICFASTHVSAEKIILSGDNTQNPHLRSIIEEKINIPTILANPFEGMKISDSIPCELVKKYAPEMMIATGLALRKFSHDNN
jgi:type IV pilus assembly protein PilM